ncbi:hypothetical protein GFY24_36175 [Nocardia sp. SYP-A9097]|uniref:hypothetical protein n=1 Tax=Nocardia sp. SYP-A9097 TaxID=2663237 RepID=UPI00129B0E24|nr:hypothetical protein [Nocardia sp. SYP-A9097]MRH92796.1 hypothetical protein [Nocardia sp. SYP-A9097]
MQSAYDSKNPEPRPRPVVVAICLLLVLASLTTYGAIRLALKTFSESSPVSLSAAADLLAKAPALSMRVVYSDVDGRQVSGDVVVTSERDTAGVITDPVGGRADLVATADRSAVQGDSDFWARRAPKKAGQLRNQWVRPNRGSEFPVDIPSTLNPTSLADFVRSLSDAATVDGDIEVIDGKRVRTLVSGGWTAALSTEDGALLWLSGPVRPGWGVRPAGVQIDLGTETTVGPKPAAPLIDPVDNDADLPHISIAPAPTEAGPTKDRVDKVLPPAAAPSTVPQAPKAMPNENDPAPFIDFKISGNTPDCWTPTCSWTVTVTNTGNTAGDATVIASATPGMATQEISLGVIAAGASATTPPMTFANPTPKPGPGQTNTIRIQYAASIFSTARDGSDDGAFRDARQRITAQNGDPKRLLVADSTLMPDIWRAFLQMTDHAPADTVVLESAIEAVDTAVGKELLPEVSALVKSGRLQNPQDLPKQISDAVKANNDGRLYEIQRAARLVRENPTARVILDGYLEMVNPATGQQEKYGADILDTANRIGYQLKVVTGPRVPANINDAIDQLNGVKGRNDQTGVWQNAPPGYQKVVEIHVDPQSARFSNSDKAWIENTLRYAQNLQLCGPDGIPRVDLLIIENSRDTFQWRKEEFGAVFGSPCQ